MPSAGSVCMPRLVSSCFAIWKFSLWLQLLLLITVPLPARADVDVKSQDRVPLFAVHAGCPDLCDKKGCELGPIQNCTGDVTQDVCDCCLTCVRFLDEPCGGLFGREGICHENLACVVQPAPKGIAMAGDEVGICKEFLLNCTEPVKTAGCNMVAKAGCQCAERLSCTKEDKETTAVFQYSDAVSCQLDWHKIAATVESKSCDNVKCDTIVQPRCPNDSVLALPAKPQPPACCEMPGVCQCSHQKCGSRNRIPTCDLGTFPVLRRPGNFLTPGSCCDVWECVPPPAKACSHVQCPKLPLDASPCPADSVRPVPKLPAGECCPVQEGCQCLPDQCAPVECPSGEDPVVTIKGDGQPGSCCDEFVCTNETMSSPAAYTEKEIACFDGSTRYAVHETWHPELCLECICTERGVKFCRQMACPNPPPDCTRWEVAKGECCAMCVGCFDAGQSYNHSDEWQPDDCTSCRCDSGTVKCQAQMCAANCDKPRKVAGQCCPECDDVSVVTGPSICPSMELCALRCPAGFMIDEHGCMICQCDVLANATGGGHVMSNECPLLQSCAKKCVHGFERNDRGCPLCWCRACAPLNQCFKQCLYGLQLNEQGCPFCKCRESAVSLPITRAPPQSAAELIPKARCASDVNAFDTGEYWFDGCRHCYCENGTQFCTLLSCPNLECKNPVLDRNDCCPKCPGGHMVAGLQQSVCQSSTGHHFVEGETWQLDKCTRCSCRLGHVLCQIQECPPTPCKTPKLRPGDCCPTCDYNKETAQLAGGDGEPCVDDVGLAHQHGGRWRDSSNQCRSCLCKNGNIQCYAEICPTAKCERPLHIKGHCCPMCLELQQKQACHYQGVMYSPGEVWKASHCMNCTCSKLADVICTQLQCLPCSRPSRMLLPGQCCPVCEDDKHQSGVLSIDDEHVTPSNKDKDSQQQHHLYIITIIACLVLAIVLLLTVSLGCYFRRHLQCLASASRSGFSATTSETTTLTRNGSITHRNSPSLNKNHCCDKEQMQSLLKNNNLYREKFEVHAHV